MAGKQAKILSAEQLDELLLFVETTRHPQKNRAIVLLSAKAGLRAAEISHLTWQMVCDAEGAIGHLIELHDVAAKKRHGRTIPIHPDLRQALISLQQNRSDNVYVISSERARKMQPLSIVVWFNRAFKALEFKGCSSHSGRRTFITQTARLVHKAGGSLRDVQVLAGHRSIQTTQRYIDGDTDAQRKLVAMI